MPTQTDPQLKIRLPAELMAFVKSEAQRNGATFNSEIIRALRERMERLSSPRPQPVA